MDSYYPNVEMVLVDDVNDIVDPLNTVDMDADIPAIKLELDDNIESDEEFRMNESEWSEANGSYEWIKRSHTPTCNVNTMQSNCENTFHDDNSEPGCFDDDGYANGDIQNEPEEHKPILTQTEVDSKEAIEDTKVEVKPVIKKVRVSHPVSRSRANRMKMVFFCTLNYRKRM